MIRMFYSILLSTLLLGMACHTQASASVDSISTDLISTDSTLIINADSTFYRLNASPYITTYTGNQPIDTIEQASQLPDSAFTVVGAVSPLRFMKTSWFRLSIKNNSSKPRSLVLDLDQALLSRVEWRSVSGAVVKEFLTGQDYPFASRDINYDLFAFTLDIPPGETLTANFSIYTKYNALFVPKITDSERFVSQLTFISRFIGAIMGMLYSVCFFLFLYIARVRKLGVEHAMFVFSLASLMSALYVAGGIQRMLPDTIFPLRDVAYIVIHAAQNIAFCMMLRGVYQTSRYYKVMDKSLWLMIAAQLLVAILIPLINIESLLLTAIINSSIIMLVALSLSVLALMRRHKQTYLFSTGLLLFICMAIAPAFTEQGLLPASLFTRYGYELGLTLLVDFIFIVMVSRIFSAEHESREMETQMIRLDAEIKARSEFVDRVTHDIKSPLSAVLGAVQLLGDKNSIADTKKYLNVIHGSCISVIGIVDDILSHSRMKANKMSLRQQPFDLKALLIDIESSIKASQQHKNLEFSLVISEDIPHLVEGDRLRLSQLLINLLTNAFKFTDEGKVSVTLDVMQKTKTEIFVRFVIQDTGIGMSESFLKQAFDSYAREENRPGYRPGFGLGLSICKQIVDMMGGTIDVLSAMDQGSRFIVVLPFAVVSE